MTSQDVRRFCEVQPIEPFAIRLIDGRTFIIPHRDFCWTVEKSLRMVIVADEDGVRHALNTTLIVSIEPSEQQRQTQEPSR